MFRSIAQNDCSRMLLPCLRIAQRGSQNEGATTKGSSKDAKGLWHFRVYLDVFHFLGTTKSTSERCPCQPGLLLRSFI